MLSEAWFPSLYLTRGLGDLINLPYRVSAGYYIRALGHLGVLSTS